MRKIKRKRNYSTYVLVACVCVFSIMGVGYGYLQQTLNVNMNLSKKDQGIDITDDVVATGDGLYGDQYENGRYVYRGYNPNNYIKFNNELWRIIAKEADGTYKIIRDELLPQNLEYTEITYDAANHRTTENNTYCTNPSRGCGVYAAVSGTFQTPNGSHSGTVTEDSSIKQYLNNTYYPTLNVVAKTQVQSHAFNIGCVQFLEKSGNDSIEKNIAGEQMYKWTGNVGLINVSDLLRASTNTDCTSATDEFNAVLENNNSMCASYLIPIPQIDEGEIQFLYWTINAASTESLDSSFGVWGVKGYLESSDFDIMHANTDRDYGVRPVVFLKSSIKLSGGTGTETDPYIIAE